MNASVGRLLPVLLVLLKLPIDVLGLSLHAHHGSLEPVILLVVNVEHTVLLMRYVIDAECELEVDHRQALQSDRVKLQSQQLAVLYL